jgi:predicted amidohydrolase
VSDPFLVAAVQLNVTDDRERNEAQARALIAEAVAAGAGFVALPENADQIAPRQRRLLEGEPLSGPLVSRYRALAKEHGIWLLLGSYAEKDPGMTRVRNTSVLLRPDGEIAAVYRKIHLFHADPPDGISYRESETVEPGTEVVTASTPFGVLGLSVCYDLRFPELYRRFSSAGASAIAVPAAFTVPTGRAHWELLLRARAVENLAYVIAPAQVGDHGHGRRSYGHSLIVDPWGTVLADAGEAGPGFVTARIDPDEIARVRAILPSLEHRRL